MLLTIIAAALLSLWFFRQNFKDGTLWMLGTYLAIGIMFWADYQAISADHQAAVPRIVRDFLLLGMVGFVQSLAVAKRISIITAVIVIFCLFAGAYFLQEMIEQDDATAGALSEATPQPFDTDDYVPSLVDAEVDADAELLVQIRDGNALTALKAAAFMRAWSVAPAFTPASPDLTVLDDYYTLDANDLATAMDVVEGIPGVIYFEPNETVQLDPIESEETSISSTDGADSFGINDPFADQQWAMRVLDMDQYYSVLSSQTPTRKAKIAILDTGVDGRHEDIQDNYYSIQGKYDNDPMGHGTHCAGIAAGVTNNSIGIGSLAGNGRQPFTEITSIKVLNAAGMGTQKSIIAGIIEAADAGADVISLSLGGPSNGSRQKAYSAAVSYANEMGTIVVAAAGNSNLDAYNYAPANADGVITVAALDEFLLRAPFSNKVNRLKQGIAAPGVGIYSTTPNSTYKSFSGTSMACPFVAGLLGVMKSIEPDLTTEEAYAILDQTGKAVRDGSLTGNVVQPAAAIRALGR